MGLIANALGVATKAATSWQPVPDWMNNKAQIQGNNYQSFAREGYMGNELVFACIEELASSAAEPTLMARSGKQWTHEHPLLTLLDNPNPFMDRYEFVATIIMHLALAGNAYALKVRSRMGKVVQLWTIRPDRVRIVPINQGFDRRYDIDIGGGQRVPVPGEDVLHWAERHPLDDLYGMPPLMPISGRVDIDNFMRDFVKAYFMNAGVPGGVLSIKQSLKADQKEEIKNRFRNSVGGPRGWHDLLIIDNNDATFTPMTAQIGTRGLVIPELDEINEARIGMVFGVPLSLVGARLGMSSSSYGNRKSDRESFWDETLAPKYKELVGPINRDLVPEFGGVDEIRFDLSDVRALQEDVDLVHTRVDKDVAASVMSIQEARLKLGLPAEFPSGHVVLVPSNMVAQPVEDLGKPPEPPAPPPVAALPAPGSQDGQ